MSFITALENALGKKAKMNMLPMQPGDVPATAADISAIQQWTGLLIMAGSIVFGQLAFKKMNEGFISLGEGMKIGIGVTALGSAIGIAYGIFQGSVLDPDTMTKAMDYAIEQAIQQNPEIGDEIVEAMEGAFEFFANPLISSSIGMAVSLFFGALISLLTGLALKKNRPA